MTKTRTSRLPARALGSARPAGGRMRRVAPAVLLPLAAACTEPRLGPLDECFMSPALIAPELDTLRVGDAVPLTARLGEPAGCLPPDLEPVVWRWTSDAPAVAGVDSVSGLLTARSAGRTLVRVRHAREARVTSALFLVVVGQ